MDVMREIEGLRRRLREMERQLWYMDLHSGYESSTDPIRLIVGDSNEIFNDSGVVIDGINLAAPVPTTVPVETPVASTTYADGLCIATDPDGNKVWLANAADPGTGTVSGLQMVIPEGTTVYSSTSVQLPLSGSPETLVTVYLTGFVHG